jgi:hypothetical protein
MNKLTLIEQDLLRSMAIGYKPQGDEPEYQKLVKEELVRPSEKLPGRYVLTTTGWKVLSEVVRS